jgi:hypothetical protein
MKRNTCLTMKILPMVIILFFLFIPQQVFAGKGKRSWGTERLVIDFGDSHYRGYIGNPVKLHLKRALRDQYPGLNIKNLNLRKVVLIGKTRVGMGRAQLRVGSEVTDMYRVSGHPRDFHYDNRRTFDRVRFRNPSYGSRGPWQLYLRGDFKVRKVVLIVENERMYRDDRDYNGSPYSSYNHRSQDGRIQFNVRW